MIPQEKCEKIQKYIKNQLEEDYMADQISMKEFIDPFTGQQVKKSMRIGALAPTGELLQEEEIQSTKVLPVTAPYRGKTNHRLSRWF